MANDDQTNPILQYENAQIAPEMQQELNKPLKQEEAVDPKDTEFLQLLVGKIEKGEIKLFVPSSLINPAVYDNLEESQQGKADYDAFNLLSTIREIYQLWTSGQKDTYQIAYLVHKMRLTKERLEEIGGDIYII